MRRHPRRATIGPCGTMTNRTRLPTTSARLRDFPTQGPARRTYGRGSSGRSPTRSKSTTGSSGRFEPATCAESRMWRLRRAFVGTSTARTSSPGFSRSHDPTRRLRSGCYRTGLISVRVRLLRFTGVRIGAGSKLCGIHWRGGPVSTAASPPGPFVRSGALLGNRARQRPARRAYSRRLPSAFAVLKPLREPSRGLTSRRSS